MLAGASGAMDVRFVWLGLITVTDKPFVKNWVFPQQGSVCSLLLQNRPAQTVGGKPCLFSLPLPKTFDRQRWFFRAIWKRTNHEETRSIMVCLFSFGFPSCSGLTAETSGKPLLVASFGAEFFFRWVVLSPSFSGCHGPCLAAVVGQIFSFGRQVPVLSCLARCCFHLAP